MHKRALTVTILLIILSFSSFDTNVLVTDQEAENENSTFVPEGIAHEISRPVRAGIQLENHTEGTTPLINASQQTYTNELNSYNLAGIGPNQTAKLDILDNIYNTTPRWTGSQLLTADAVDANPSAVAVDEKGVIHIIWTQAARVYHKYWDPASETWTAPVTVSNTGGSAYQQTSRPIAIDSKGNLHVVYVENSGYAGSGSDFDTTYVQWNSSTRSWGTWEIVSSTSTQLST
ncbi:MAG: hypothetical protein ACXAE3_10665, partial [Candidatus Kariarchaeaceae archaeon]